MRFIVQVCTGSQPTVFLMGVENFPFDLFKIDCGSIELKEGAKILYKARLLDVLVPRLLVDCGRHTPFFSKLPMTYKVSMAVFWPPMVSSPIILGSISGRVFVHFKRIRCMANAVAEYSTFNKFEILLSVTIWIASATMLWSICRGHGSIIVGWMNGCYLSPSNWSCNYFPFKDLLIWGIMRVVGLRL